MAHPDYFTGTLQQCEEYIAKLDLMMGYPNLETKTFTYAKPKKHDKKDQYMVPIKEVHAPKLKRKALIADIDGVSTPQERTAMRKTYKELDTDGAFKKS